jgi:hypothetical protein
MPCNGEDQYDTIFNCRLKHQDTGVYLASHDVKYDRPIPGHTEVYGGKKAGKKTSWKSVEGVYFPQRAES